MLLIDGKARGIITRNLITGEIERHSAHAVVLATGGYGTIYYLPPLQSIQMHRQHGKHIKKEHFLQIQALSDPSYMIPQLHEFQSKLTLMSESLRNDGRVWVPKKKGDKRPANNIPEEERDYYLERRYPALETWFQGMLHQGQQRNVVMKVMVLEKPDLLYILISEMQ